MRTPIVLFAIVACIVTILFFLPPQKHAIPFNSDQWCNETDVNLDGGDRDQMVDDLMARHLLSNRSRIEVLELLGRSESPIDGSLILNYPLKITYDVIDPDYSKYLNVIFSRDSIVKEIQIEEWEKGEEAKIIKVYR